MVSRGVGQSSVFQNVMYWLLILSSNDRLVFYISDAILRPSVVYCYSNFSSVYTSILLVQHSHVVRSSIEI
jgi:hypothetical protein